MSAHVHEPWTWRWFERGRRDCEVVTWAVCNELLFSLMSLKEIYYRGALEVCIPGENKEEVLESWLDFKWVIGIDQHKEVRLVFCVEQEIHLLREQVCLMQAGVIVRYEFITGIFFFFYKRGFGVKFSCAMNSFSNR